MVSDLNVTSRVPTALLYGSGVTLTYRGPEQIRNLPGEVA